MVTDCDIFSANEKQKNEFRHLLGLVSATFRRKVNCQAIVQFKKKKKKCCILLGLDSTEAVRSVSVFKLATTTCVKRPIVYHYLI